MSIHAGDVDVVASMRGHTPAISEHKDLIRVRIDRTAIVGTRIEWHRLMEAVNKAIHAAVHPDEHDFFADDDTFEPVGEVPRLPDGFGCTCDEDEHERFMADEGMRTAAEIRGDTFGEGGA